jgi:quercetin dioxygenase-like cupin family protein
VSGPSDFLQVRVVAQPAGDTGWHTHPGPAVGVVRAGSVTEYHANGCVSVYGQGSVFFEQPGEVHRVVNEGNSISEVYLTFFLPAGTAPLLPADAPEPRTCKSEDAQHHR